MPKCSLHSQTRGRAPKSCIACGEMLGKTIRREEFRKVPPVSQEPIEEIHESPPNFLPQLNYETALEFLDSLEDIEPILLQRKKHDYRVMNRAAILTFNNLSSSQKKIWQEYDIVLQNRALSRLKEIHQLSTENIVGITTIARHLALACSCDYDDKLIPYYE